MEESVIVCIESILLCVRLFSRDIYSKGFDIIEMQNQEHYLVMLQWFVMCLFETSERLNSKLH